MHLQEASPLSQGRNNYGKSHATKSPSVSMSQAESRLQGTSQFYLAMPSLTFFTRLSWEYIVNKILEGVA